MQSKGTLRTRTILVQFRGLSRATAMLCGRSARCSHDRPPSRAPLARLAAAAAGGGAGLRCALDPGCAVLGPAVSAGWPWSARWTCCGCCGLARALRLPGPARRWRRSRPRSLVGLANWAIAAIQIGAQLGSCPGQAMASSGRTMPGRWPASPTTGVDGVWLLLALAVAAAGPWVSARRRAPSAR